MQNQKKGKPEPGLTEEQVETLKQVSSLVAMFQQEALNEKQTRLLAQLKAIEKVRFECSLCSPALFSVSKHILSLNILVAGQISVRCLENYCSPEEGKRRP